MKAFQFLAKIEGNQIFTSFAGNKFVKVFTSLPSAFTFTYALYPMLNYEFPAHASWTWEVMQRLFEDCEGGKGILRGQKKDPHGLNKCDFICGEISKILPETIGAGKLLSS